MRGLRFYILAMVALTIALAVVLPNFLKKRTTRSESSCVGNLHMIAGAKAMLESDRKLTAGTVITTSELLPYVREWPKCPEGGAYLIGTVGQPPRCSYPEHQHFTSKF